jgi:hypothetical protein
MNRLLLWHRGPAATGGKSPLFSRRRRMPGQSTRSGPTPISGAISHTRHQASASSSLRPENVSRSAGSRRAIRALVLDDPATRHLAPMSRWWCGPQCGWLGVSLRTGCRVRLIAPNNTRDCPPRSLVEVLDPTIGDEHDRARGDGIRIEDHAGTGGAFRRQHLRLAGRAILRVSRHACTSRSQHDPPATLHAH